jgi:hypothetical protein
VQTLAGHTSPETAYVVDDYPYGFRLRCQIRYWLEFKPGHGFRLVGQTSNPTHPGLVWNKPKPGVYYAVAVMVLDDQGHTTIDTLSAGGRSDEARIIAYEQQHAAALTDDHCTAIRYVRASTKMHESVTFEIKPDDGSPRQTREEQRGILTRALAAGYRDAIAAERSAGKPAA